MKEIIKNIFIHILKTVSVTKENYCFPVNGEWREEEAFRLTMLDEYEEQLLTSRDYHFIRSFRSSTPDVPRKEWYQSESSSKFVQSEGYQNSTTLCKLGTNSRRDNIEPLRRRNRKRKYLD